MTREEIRQAVADGVAAGLAEYACRCCSTCEMKPLEHRDQHKAISDVGLDNFYDHHKAVKDIGLDNFYADHRFAREARTAVRHGKQVIVTELIKHVVTALVTGGALYAALKGLGR